MEEHEGGGDKRKLGGNENGHQKSKKQKWKNRGVNKNRPTFKVDRESQLCSSLVDRRADSDPGCSWPGCCCIHDVKLYLDQKPASLGEECYVYNTSGYCPRGVTCRYGSKHVTEGGLNIVNEILHEEWKADAKLQTTGGLKQDLQIKLRKRTYNFHRSEEILQQWNTQREKKKDNEVKNGVDLETKSETHVNNETASSKEIESEANVNSETASSKVIESEANVNSETASSKVIESEANVNSETPSSVLDSDPEPGTKGDSQVDFNVGPVLDYDSIKIRDEEKRRVDWKNKLFLSPLTTVGNLPFRRICKEFGADVTCGEMALAVSLLQGKSQEWALTKRHGSEDLFGVQLCGSNANVMTKCAQLVQEQANVDFVDINVGCPIDLIYQQGAGSGLLNKKKVLFSMVKCMKSVLDVPLTVKSRTGVYSGKNVAHTFMQDLANAGADLVTGAGSGLLNKKKVLFSMVKCMKSVLDVPLTVKSRTGVYSGKNVAHTFMQDLANAGADLVTIHGRTKEQRYTKLADWDYIEQCARLAAPTPVIGNGDILSYEDYDLARERSPTAASIMIGRGALIKPWIFTELKERRHWDISSEERLQMLRRYTNYGLEHWGSDTRGIEATRRFLLEWLSFLYRYVPVGLLENPPQKMNERPPKFQGRDELEELMASPNSADWIIISEMLLGPVPSNFQFLPKHKANSWT